MRLAKCSRTLKTARARLFDTWGFLSTPESCPSPTVMFCCSKWSPNSPPGLLVERWCREQKHGKSFLGYCDANKKDQGGLGVKDLYTWNKACSLRLVWLLFFRPDSVWVSWFKEVILKGSIQNYWTTKPKSGGVLDRQLESLWMPWNFPWCWYYKTRHPDKCASLQQGRILSSNYWLFWRQSISLKIQTFKIQDVGKCSMGVGCLAFKGDSET